MSGLLSPFPSVANASLAVGPLLHRTDRSFVGATIDWWRENDPHYGSKFGRAGALTLDLGAPGLVAVAKALSPGLLRVGGTPADGIIYDTSTMSRVVSARTLWSQSHSVRPRPRPRPQHMHVISAAKSMAA